MGTGRSAGVTAVVFDYGGVLTGPPFDRVAEFEAANALPADAIMSFFDEPEWEDLMLGKASVVDWMKSLGRRVQDDHGVHIDLRALGVLLAGEGPQPAMLDMLRELHERGIVLGILTNNVQESAWRGLVPVELLDVVVDSSEVGLAKPDPRIYELLLSKLGRAGEQVAYFDDLEENIPPARALGIQAFLFQDPAQCRKELEGLGVLRTSG
ncbi:MAG: HAD family phosphatase [Actinomycetota bacterium]